MAHEIFGRQIASACNDMTVIHHNDLVMIGSEKTRSKRAEHGSIDRNFGTGGCELLKVVFLKSRAWEFHRANGINHKSNTHALELFFEKQPQESFAVGIRIKDKISHDDVVSRHFDHFDSVNPSVFVVFENRSVATIGHLEDFTVFDAIKGGVATGGKSRIVTGCALRRVPFLGPRGALIMVRNPDMKLHGSGEIWHPRDT